MSTLTNSSGRRVIATASLVVFAAAFATILGMAFNDHQPPFWLWVALVGGFGAVVSAV